MSAGACARACVWRQESKKARSDPTQRIIIRVPKKGGVFLIIHLGCQRHRCHIFSPSSNWQYTPAVNVRVHDPQPDPTRFWSAGLSRLRPSFRAVSSLGRAPSTLESPGVGGSARSDPFETQINNVRST